MLKLVPVVVGKYRMVSVGNFLGKKLHNKELQAQGIVGKAATLSCTYVPTDLYAGWCSVHGLPVSQVELALEGLTRIAGATNHRVFASLGKPSTFDF